MSKHLKGPFENKRGLFVEVRNNNIDSALRALNGKIKREGIIRELRRREYYEPPSTMRRRKAADARRRSLKAKNKIADDR